MTLLMRWATFAAIYSIVTLIINPEGFTRPIFWIILLGYFAFTALLEAIFGSEDRDRA